MDVKAIGEKIKRKRTALGMTQKQLAQLLSVSNQLVSKWENGESVPSLEYLDSLCRALEVGYSYFTGDDNTGSTDDEGRTEDGAQAERNQLPQEGAQSVKVKRKFNWRL
ncbi:MAG: helix-turn-helix domain-containing protein, partial [Clostridia bacterium]|nr:helix-turn-helix domain-containing protein [Clostridia bacterium]